jgi:hypothetical protein
VVVDLRGVVPPGHRAAEAPPDTDLLGDVDDALRLQLCRRGLVSRPITENLVNNDGAA